MTRGELSPAARRLCDAMVAGFPGPGDAAALRAAVAAGAPARPAGPEVASVYDTTAGGVPVRVYDPAPGAAGRPLAVYLHGGGWVMCGPDTHDALCRALASASGAVVVSADYRLAPEHPWPAAADDALAVLLWVRAEAQRLGCDPARVVVAGDSSGGNLAAVTALRAPGLVAGQLLAYPPLDASMGSESVAAYGRGYFHTAAHMAWYWDQYGGDPAHPHVSPLRAADVAGLPRTLIVLADCDLLRDEGLEYARRLGEAGVDCEVRLYPGVFHGFLGLPLPAARAAVAGAAAWLAATP
ncbi:alpha/beta hydrolase [Streptomyces lavendulae]|uniref:alpha/beta hydrolase n=1 Tax=Streptomyces lavendulae TaxID=1914 RepID=UPI0024A1C280|nr:alpha/beta hydrolase [Streptomyces lavendulae]GLX20082.1 putative lipase/esterase [Streptomyces lavendulae subsp. lavendulae]GLX27483.1 putative lipase/esterase [Streptomyces lavendulae subsp. lavendulae]